MGINVRVSISNRSKELISQLLPLVGDDDLKALNSLDNDELSRDALVSWLTRDIPHNKKSRLLLESLRVALLKDLHESFLMPEKCTEKKKKKPSGWFGTLKLTLLAIAGTVLAVCEAFDGISSILGLFTTLPTVLIFSLVIVSSALSVSVFFGFDLVEISRNLGVKFGRSRQMLDIFMDQVEQIDVIKKDIDDCYSETTDTAELQFFQRTIEMLRIRYNYLDGVRATYTSALKNPYLRVAKLVMASISGAVFFCGGFFAGQSLAIMVGSLFAASVSATFWPIILVGAVVGLAALCIYWFVQRPGLTNLVGRWLGLDRDKIDVFAGDEFVEGRKEELLKLETSVALVQGMRKQLSRLSTFDKMTSQKPLFGGALIPPPPTTTRGMFFKPARSRSLDDLHKLDQTADFGFA